MRPVRARSLMKQLNSKDFKVPQEEGGGEGGGGGEEEGEKTAWSLELSFFSDPEGLILWMEEVTGIGELVNGLIYLLGMGVHRQKQISPGLSAGEWGSSSTSQ